MRPVGAARARTDLGKGRWKIASGTRSSVPWPKCRTQPGIHWHLRHDESQSRPLRLRNHYSCRRLDWADRAQVRRARARRVPRGSGGGRVTGGEHAIEDVRRHGALPPVGLVPGQDDDDGCGRPARMDEPARRRRVQRPQRQPRRVRAASSPAVERDASRAPSLLIQDPGRAAGGDDGDAAGPSDLRCQIAPRVTQRPDRRGSHQPILPRRAQRQRAGSRYILERTDRVLGERSRRGANRHCARRIPGPSPVEISSILRGGVRP